MALTSNKNFLSPVGFTLKIDSGMANTEYFCTAANIPGISLTNVDTPYKGVNLGMTGDRLTFDDLSITFNICLLYTSPSPRDGLLSRMPSSA